MTSVIDIVLLGLLGLAGYRLWNGTTSMAARAVSLACVAYLAWVFVRP